ncbi:hypothetical protein PtrSN002B_011715, partial [Pyrenophora tritici-repentis]
ALPEAPWVAQTPSNARELEAQSSLIRERVRQHKSSSPASIIMAIDQLKKGAEVMMLSAELMRDRISSLEKANSAASERATQQGTDDQSDSKHALGMTVKAKTMITVPLKRPDAPKPAMAPPKLRATELGAAPQRIRPQR